MLEGINEKADRMPQPKFIQVAQKSEIAFTDNQKPTTLTLNWQWVLGKISRALINNASIEVIKLLTYDLEFTQIIKNAIDDIQDLTRQTVNQINLSSTITKLEVVKRLLAESERYQNNTETRDPVVNELSYLVVQLQGLGVIGLGAFMIAASLQLALLQEQAKSDSKQWRNIKTKVMDWIAHCSATTPQLFRLSVGRIDKSCHCLEWQTHTETAVITEYECRYFDGRDTHIFRNTTPAAIATCNLHRLQMFYTVTARVNYTAVIPIRTAIKQWRRLAASL